ncbi:MAG: YraN family protein [Bacteroidales bacterium]|nr:YraN family protein [Bacteroidales bacterium]
MAEHNDIGKIGEGLARDYLKKNGYQILEVNWQFRKDEIDIIAENEEYIVIAEVKTRTTNYWGEPEVFVNKQKQRLMVRAANAYLEQSDSDKEVRFDIIAVLLARAGINSTILTTLFHPLI